jgi:crotonobetainyl-CoA:carnitine CoA-transferase CaiB-like acyl-CoA transferase
MSGPMEGIKVVEMGVWVAGPSAAVILRDWGADVVKLEPPTGDPFRGLFASALGVSIPVNPPFEVDNRGKRSVALDFTKPEARAIGRQLLDGADVFVSNMRPRVLEQFGFGYDEVRKTNPRIIYCSISGYGSEGADRDRAAYDIGAFWSRSGMAMALTAPGSEIPQQRGGMGDHMTGMNAAGAISAALFKRERTGEGQRVAVSLVRTGIYMMGWDYALELRLGAKTWPYNRYGAVNPIINCFKTKDERWIWLLLLQADRHWPDLIRAVERPDILEDPRWNDIGVRRENGEALVRELDKEFVKRTMDEWGAILDSHDVWWAPVNTITQAIQDPVVQASGAIQEVAGPDGTIPLVNSPADFYSTPVGPQGPAPELGQHTEEVLLELGYDWDKIIALKDSGAIP